MEVPELILRISLGFLVLFTLTRILGRKEISQMTFFNFVSAIAIGSIAATLVVSNSLSIRNGVIALTGWSIFTLVMDFIDIKFRIARKFTTGEPIIVIKEGKIISTTLAKCRLDIDSLTTLLRQKNIFSIAEVEYAIFETNGNLSVMKKEPIQPITKSDLNILNTKKKPFPIATEVVSDGNILTNNLTKLNLNTDWLEQQLQQAGIQSVSEVFFAQVQQDGSLYIDKKEKLIH